MAKKSTVLKAALNVADMDRGVYEDFNVTLAQHPSETDERMMLRLIAFVLHAHERLEFGRGISTDDEPDLWLRSLSGVVDLWVDLGLPTERRMRKACGRSTEVVLYCYGDRAAPIWWTKHEQDLKRLKNLRVYMIPDDTSQALVELAGTNMSLQCSIQDAELIVSTMEGSQVVVAPQPWR